MTRVLLAEDDPGISDPLARAFRREGYAVEVVRDGASAVDRAQRDLDLLVLDLGLPELDGLEVCRRLRQQGHIYPILILTARADEVDTVVGLDAGADDYVTKPFRLAELLARTRALLRRVADDEVPEEDARLAVRVDVASHRAWRGEEELQLTGKEFQLLSVLIEDAGRVVTREDLMRRVWNSEWFGSTKALDMHISVLRRKLATAVDSRYITTVRGVGFRFDGPLR